MKLDKYKFNSILLSDSLILISYSSSIILLNEQQNLFYRGDKLCIKTQCGQKNS